MKEVSRFVKKFGINLVQCRVEVNLILSFENYSINFSLDLKNETKCFGPKMGGTFILKDSREETIFTWSVGSRGWSP